MQHFFLMRSLINFFSVLLHATGTYIIEASNTEIENSLSCHLIMLIFSSDSENKKENIVLNEFRYFMHLTNSVVYRMAERVRFCYNFIVLHSLDSTPMRN